MPKKKTGAVGGARSKSPSPQLIGCNCPTECIVGSPVTSSDAVVVFDCSQGSQCPVNGRMHEMCFEMFEEKLLRDLMSARLGLDWHSKGEEDARKFLWSRKGQELVVKAKRNPCACGKGYISRAEAFVPAPSNKKKKKQVKELPAVAFAAREGKEWVRSTIEQNECEDAIDPELRARIVDRSQASASPPTTSATTPASTFVNDMCLISTPAELRSAFVSTLWAQGGAVDLASCDAVAQLLQRIDPPLLCSVYGDTPHENGLHAWLQNQRELFYLVDGVLMLNDAVQEGQKKTSEAQSPLKPCNFATRVKDCPAVAPEKPQKTAPTQKQVQPPSNTSKKKKKKQPTTSAFAEKKADVGSAGDGLKSNQPPASSHVFPSHQSGFDCAEKSHGGSSGNAVHSERLDSALTALGLYCKFDCLDLAFPKIPKTKDCFYHVSTYAHCPTSLVASPYEQSRAKLEMFL